MTIFIFEEFVINAGDFSHSLLRIGYSLQIFMYQEKRKSVWRSMGNWEDWMQIISSSIKHRIQNICNYKHNLIIKRWPSVLEISSCITMLLFTRHNFICPMIIRISKYVCSKILLFFVVDSKTFTVLIASKYSFTDGRQKPINSFFNFLDYKVDSPVLSSSAIK